jgi:hypothetical protein
MVKTWSVAEWTLDEDTRSFLVVYVTDGSIVYLRAAWDKDGWTFQEYK